ncbi:hypothetical protein [Rhizobium sp. SSA_523]|uniref:hypothetical protein n=1 Tax=Rhizobium sp. SSA_523 TaxID=2952477 RepID=UPI0020916C50|nr:hypothetical protein [Rhizobium sp. SSA_523]MCO5730951.1 hypothetical protein [Rhizobium sp. SSA_523]WKC24240.1 hypothetical protein QTJ18_09185 [Rhizobium sp. SSA_523]
MAEIVVLKKWRDMHPERGFLRLDRREGADVVLFTGVRYERIEDVTHRTMDDLSLRADSGKTH